nr:MAG TPA: hypothetical protein [Siphovirus LN-2020-2]
MKLLPALVVGLTATFLAVQDLKSEKKEPEEKAVETPVEPEEEVKEPTMDEYEEIVNDEYLDITMEDDLSEIMGEDFEEEDDEAVAEGDTIRAISEEEYEEGAFGFERVDLMYFVDDEVLCDSDMITIDNKDEWLGDVDLILGTDSIVTVMWIRNFNLSYDIRLEIVEDSYSGSR